MTDSDLEYEHILKLGGLLSDGAPVDETSSPMAELTDDDHRSELRRRQSHGYAELRDKVASLLLEYEINPEGLSDDEYIKLVDDCRQSLVETRSYVHDLSESDTVIVKDIIANSQITDLIKRLDKFKKSIRTVERRIPPRTYSDQARSSDNDEVARIRNAKLVKVIYETKYIYADILISFAQADSKVDQRERDLLDDIFSNMNLDLNILRKMWLTPRTVEILTAILENITDQVFKCCLLKDLYLVAYVDDSFVTEEMFFIDRLKTAANLGRELDTTIHKWAAHAVKANNNPKILFSELIADAGVVRK